MSYRMAEFLCFSSILPVGGDSNSENYQTGLLESDIKSQN